MAIVVWTDTYATVAQMDSLLRANPKWMGLQLQDPDTGAPDAADTDGVLKKEAHIIAATQAIDNAMDLWGADKVSAVQALQFPRDFECATDDPLFTTAAQLRRLVTATGMQINADLSINPIGVGDALGNSPGTVGAQATPRMYGQLCPAAAKRLMVFADRTL